MRTRRMHSTVGSFPLLNPNSSFWKGSTMKKFFTLLLLVVAIGGFSLGCAKDDATDPVDPPTAGDGDDVDPEADPEADPEE